MENSIYIHGNKIYNKIVFDVGANDIFYNEVNISFKRNY